MPAATRSLTPDVSGNQSPKMWQMLQPKLPDDVKQEDQVKGEANQGRRHFMPLRMHGSPLALGSLPREEKASRQAPYARPGGVAALYDIQPTQLPVSKVARTMFGEPPTVPMAPWQQAPDPQQGAPHRDSSGFASCTTPRGPHQQPPLRTSLLPEQASPGVTSYFSGDLPGPRGEGVRRYADAYSNMSCGRLEDGLQSKISEQGQLGTQQKRHGNLQRASSPFAVDDDGTHMPVNAAKQQSSITGMGARGCSPLGIRKNASGGALHAGLTEEDQKLCVDKAIGLPRRGQVFVRHRGAPLPPRQRRINMPKGPLQTPWATEGSEAKDQTVLNRASSRTPRAPYATEEADNEASCNKAHSEELIQKVRVAQMMSSQQSRPCKSFCNARFQSRRAKSVSPETELDKQSFLAAHCKPSMTCKPHFLRSASAHCLRDMGQRSAALTSEETTADGMSQSASDETEPDLNGPQGPECEASGDKGPTRLTRSRSELSVRRGSKEIRQDFVKRSTSSDSLVRSGRRSQTWSSTLIQEFSTPAFDIESESVSLEEQDASLQDQGTSPEGLYKMVIDYSRNASSRTSTTASFDCQEVPKVDICCSEMMEELIGQSAERIQMMRTELAIMHVQQSKDVRDQFDDGKKLQRHPSISRCSTRLTTMTTMSSLSNFSDES